MICLALQLFLPIYLHGNVGPPSPQSTTSPGLPAAALPALSSSHESSPPGCLSLPGCLSPPLLPVWMNVSSLTSWLLDFHKVQFSVSSGCFFVFKLLLSFFWLCEEAQCVYLRLHLGWKFEMSIRSTWIVC